jgi:hypothetical protein
MTSALYCGHYLKAFVKYGALPGPLQSEVISNFLAFKGLQTKTRNVKADKYKRDPGS